jgi:hypothetical protein
LTLEEGGCGHDAGDEAEEDSADDAHVSVEASGDRVLSERMWWNGKLTGRMPGLYRQVIDP